MLCPARVFFLSLIFSIAIGKSIKQKGSKDDSKSTKKEVEVREMPCVSNSHCEAGKICQMGKCAVSKDSKDGKESEKDSKSNTDTFERMPCVSDFHCEAGKICQMGKCAVSKDSKDGKESEKDSKSSKDEVEVKEMPCVSNLHCEAGKICQFGKCVSKDSKDGREEKDSGEDNKFSLNSGDLFQSKTEKEVDSKCCAPTKRQLENYKVTSCFEVRFDPSNLEKKDIVVNGMPFTKTSRKSDDGGSYIRYTGDEYKYGKGYINKLDEKSKSIGHFLVGVGDNEYTEFELNKCKDSFIFKQLEYNEHGR